MGQEEGTLAKPQQVRVGCAEFRMEEDIQALAEGLEGHEFLISDAI